MIFISGHRVKDMWSLLIKRVQDAKRKYVADEKFKAQIDELVSIMVFTRVEMKAAGLFNIDLSVITSVSADTLNDISFDFPIKSADCLIDCDVLGCSGSIQNVRRRRQ